MNPVAHPNPTGQVAATQSREAHTCAIAEGTCAAPSRLEGSLPKFERISLDTLAADARRARWVLPGFLVATAVGLFGSSVATGAGLAWIGSKFLGVSLPPGVPSAVLGTPIVIFAASYIFKRPAVFAALQSLIGRSFDVQTCYDEAIKYGAVCKGCDYPIVNMPRCPECGEGNKRAT